MQEVELSRTRCSSSRYFGMYIKAATMRQIATIIKIIIINLFQNKTLHQIEYFRYFVIIK